jgi:ketosteroid isomerase-like protein
MDTLSDPAAIVSSIYDAFGRGDLAAVLERVAEDVSWEEWPDNSAQRAGVPWLQHRRGKEGVKEFFDFVSQVEIHKFRVMRLMAAGNHVAAEVVVDFVLPSGARYQDEEVHLWTLGADGKVTRVRHYVDTAKHIRAAGLSADT